MTAPSFFKLGANGYDGALAERRIAAAQRSLSRSHEVLRAFAQTDEGGTSAVTILPLLHAADWTFCRRDLEEAFRALVGWPNEAPVPNLNAGQRCDLLGATCRAPIQLDDDSIMPGETFDLILDEAGSDRIASGTYAHGARAVLATPKFFDLLQREPVR